MGKIISERVRLMMQNFIFHHERGENIYEIAERYGLSFSSVYKNLQEIADQNNVSRSSLLERPKSKHSKPRVSYFVLKKEILSPKELAEDLNKLICQLQETNSIIEKLKEDFC